MLDALRLRFAEDDVLYWQDKARREVDFVIRRAGGRADAVECKINPDKLNPGPMEAFRKRHPLGDNYIATPLPRERYTVKRGALAYTVCSIADIG